MTRGWQSNLQAEWQGPHPSPIFLLDVATGLTSAGNTNIRITSNETDYVWPTSGGPTYSARGFSLQDIKIEGGEYPSITFSLADADSYWDTWLASTTFDHQRVKLWRIDRDVTTPTPTTTAYSTVDVFRVTDHGQDGYVFSLTCEPLQGILARFRIPARIMTREDFPGMPSEGVVR